MKQLIRNRYGIIFTIAFCLCQMLPTTLIAQRQEMAITTSSDEARELFLQGREGFELIEVAAAAQLFEQAFNRDPHFALAYLYRFGTGVGGPEVAQKYLDKALALVDQVSEGEKYLILYSKAQFDGEGLKQKEYLDMLLDLFPTDKRMQYLAGRYFNYEVRDLQTALKYYQRAIKLDTTFAPVYNYIGYVQLDMGNEKEAEKAFIEQIKLVPDRPNPYDSYAEFLIRMNRFDESIMQYKKALEVDASFAFANVGIGNNLLFKGDHESARKYYEKYFESPNIDVKFGALNRIASSYVLEGNIGKALKIYKRYRLLAKENDRIDAVITSYQNEGLILTETGNPEEGLFRYQKAIQIVQDPKTPEVVRNNQGLQSRFFECYALLVSGEMKTALLKIEACKKIAQKRQVPSDQRWISYLTGLVEIHNGNYEQALESYSNSWPDLPFIKYYMAIAYEKMGQREKATQLFRELKNRKQNNLPLALVKQRVKKEAKI
jgi:tetratricopeptide (TPR) repeat protein